MTTFLALVLVAIVGGVAVVLQAQFMGVMDQQIGTLESVFITYGSGGLLVGLTMLVLRGGNLAAWRGVPPYVLITGMLGLIIVGSIGYVTPRLGLVTAFTILIATQFLLGGVIDHFGWFGAEVRPLDLTKLLGVGVLMLGIWLIIRN
ncbi:MAG: DMT family transporter [Ardenticatenaceae bacterium]|nr:DMT family transporter [Ardenticatenaceae bacterium]MCB8949649.1 DMT family transporter [Ardenticatenaceae bacterium]